MNVKKVEGKVVSKEVGPRFEMKRKLLLIWNFCLLMCGQIIRLVLAFHLKV